MTSGSMAAFGLPEAAPVTDEAEETATEETSPEETSPEEDTRSSLSRVRESYRASPEVDNGAAGVQRDMDALRGSVDGRLADIRKEIRALGDTPEEKTAPTGSVEINFEDPKVGEAFREVYDSEDPVAFGRAVGAVVKMGVDSVRQEMDERLGKYDADAAKTQSVEENNRNFASNLTKALPRIRAIGEQENVVVEDYLMNGDASFLGQYFHKFPSLTQDEQGIMGAALAVARMIDIADARLESVEAGGGETAAPTERSVRTEAAPARGSNRSVQRIRDDAKGKDAGDLTPAEALRKSVVEAGGPTRNLPRVFH